MKHKKSKLVLLSIICLCATTLFSQDFPADFGDVIDDNPTDATLVQFVWVLILLVCTLAYFAKKNPFKRNF